MEIIGHKKQREYLKKIAELDKVPQAVLFTGQAHLGKKPVALEWISLIFGQNLTSHPDLVLITPEQEQIRISQIRDLSWRLALKPIRASFKAAILDQAHQMNEEAQNCFLKTLEEPKGKTLLILITEWPETLLPTIRSRCEIIKFYPVPKLEIENYLKNQGVSKEKAKEIADISLGRPGVAIDFISNPQKLENQKKIIKELIEVSNSPLGIRFQYAGGLAKTLNLKEVLDIWLSYFRNILLEKCLTPGVKQPVPKLKNIIKQIQNTNFLLFTTNINPRLALEILMLEL